MITLSSLDVTTFKPFANSQIEAQRLAGMLLSGVVLPSKFTDFTVYLADIAFPYTSDDKLNSYVIELQDKLLEDSYTLDLKSVYKLWSYQDKNLLDCFLSLLKGLEDNLPRLLLEQEMRMDQFIEQKYQEVYGLSYEGIAEFITANYGAPKPLRSADRLQQEVLRMRKLIEYTDSQTLEVSFPKKPRGSVDTLEDILQRLTEVSPIITGEVDCNVYTLYYFIGAYSKVLSRIPPLDRQSIRQTIEALESFKCLCEPLKLLEFAQKEVLETQVGAQDLMALFSESYVYNVLEYVNLKDEYTYQRQISIERSLGINAESPTDLISSQKAIQAGYFI